MNATAARDVLEVEQMLAETARIRAETERLKAEQDKLAAKTALKMQVEISKLIAETTKTERETKWHPVMLVSAAFGAAAALIAATVSIVKMLLIAG